MSMLLLLASQALLLPLLTQKITAASKEHQTGNSAKNNKNNNNGNNENKKIDQEINCQGNFITCQNILTNIICSHATCIIGKLDPFLLATPH
jgi:hypothetical protein